MEGDTQVASRTSLLRLALVGELLLVLLALIWAHYRGIPLRVVGETWYRDAGVGAVVAAAFAIVNFGVLCRAPAYRPVRAMRGVYRDLLKPAFAGIGVREVVAVSIAAGVGEELLFRGVLQPEIGLIPASLVFGALHTGGRGTLAFGCWVALMGAGLGWLAAATGGLLAPIVAHALYDAAALVYIRWGRDCAAVADRHGGRQETREAPSIGGPPAEAAIAAGPGCGPGRYGKSGTRST